MTFRRNPYVAGNPVGDSPAFIGRQNVLREVLRMLRRPQDNAILLFGQRRIGKTSILQHLAARLPDEGPYQAVYFDLQDKADWSMDRMLEDLAYTIANALAQSDPDLGFTPETAFRDEWLPTVLTDLPEGCSLVLLFDEFDVLANPQKEQETPVFFHYLRNLLALDPERLQFVFVIGRNVDDLTTIALSLFKGIRCLPVSLLNQQDTAILVRLSQENDTLEWPDEAVEQVWQLTHGHPFLTQQLCSHVWERAYDEEPDEPPVVAPEDVDTVISDALESSRNTLEWLWDGLPAAERIVISALAEAGPDPVTQDQLEQLLQESGVRVVIRELEDAPELLQEWDLIEPSNGDYRFRVELLRRWITEYKPLRRVHQEIDHIEPTAQSLYQAAEGFYKDGGSDKAVEYLREAIDVNRYHVKANQLLADIFLKQGQPDEARELMERLYEYQPGAARSRLVQALLEQARAIGSDGEQPALLRVASRSLQRVGLMRQIQDKQLALYEQVLKLAPQEREATAGRQRIWKQRGDAALESDDLAAAREAYQMAKETDKVAEVEQEMQRRDLAARRQEVESSEESGHYYDALNLARRLAEEYPEAGDWTADLDRLESKMQLVPPYRRALGLWQDGHREEAKDLLLKIITSDPEFEEATRYLHLFVTGVDVAQLGATVRRMRFMVPVVFVAGMILGFALLLGGNVLYSGLITVSTQTSTPSITHTAPVPTATASPPTPTPTDTPSPTYTSTSTPVVPTPTHLPPVVVSPTELPIVAPNLWGIHEVCEGQTLYTIAGEYSTYVDSLATINLIADRDQLSIGRLLVVPLEGQSETLDLIHYQVALYDTLSTLADEYATSVDAIRAVNGLYDPDVIRPGEDLIIPAGLLTAPRTNECSRTFWGSLNHPTGYDVYLRSRPELDANQPDLVVANRTRLKVLGKNTGTSGGPWYKVEVEVTTGEYHTGWLRSVWVQLDSDVSSEEIPFTE